MLRVTCAIIISKNKILVTQNNLQSDHPMQWEFPGGKVLPNETDIECIIREIKEELEIEIEVRQALKEVVFDYGFKKIELVPFICNIVKGNIVLNEHNAYKWLTLNECRNISLSEADEKLIQHKANGIILEKYIREQVDNT